MMESAMEMSLEELVVMHGARELTESESAFLFRLRAYRAEIVDDEARVIDFKSLRLQSFWIHADPPITRMTMRELCDTVNGLEWLLLSDVYDEARTEKWFEEFHRALELARSRAFYLIQHENQREILDAEEYTEFVHREREEAEYDYDSDEENRGKKRVKVDKTWLEAFELVPSRVNDMFVKDMDGSFRAMDQELFLRWKYRDRIERSERRVNLSSLRERVFREIQQIKETTALTHRREWIQRLLVVPSYVRRHARWCPHDPRPTNRAVLARMHETLARTCVPTSMLDIVIPPPASAGYAGAVDLRMNTDAAVFYVCASEKKDAATETIVNIEDERPGIARFRAYQRWILITPDGRMTEYDSFSAAFVELGFNI